MGDDEEKDEVAREEEHRPELPSLDDGQGGPAPVGVLFAAAAIGLFVLLFVIGLVAYFALGRASLEAPSNAIALLSAPPSGQA